MKFNDFEINLMQVSLDHMHDHLKDLFNELTQSINDGGGLMGVESENEALEDTIPRLALCKQLIKKFEEKSKWGLFHYLTVCHAGN